MNPHLLAIATAMGLQNPTDEAAIVAHAQKWSEKFTDFESVVNALREKMGVDAKGDLVAAASSLVAGAKPDPSQYVPMSVHSEISNQLAELQKQTKTEKALEAVTAAMQAGKITPGQKAWALDLASSSPDKFDDYLKNAPTIIVPGTADTSQKVAASTELDASELAICQQLGISPEAFKKTKADTAV